MNDSAKKLLKTCAVGGALYLLTEFGYALGQGSMLRIMLKHNTEPKTALEIVSSHKDEQLSFRKHLKYEFISFIASI